MRVKLIGGVVVGLVFIIGSVLFYKGVFFGNSVVSEKLKRSIDGLVSSSYWANTLGYRDIYVKLNPTKRLWYPGRIRLSLEEVANGNKSGYIYEVYGVVTRWNPVEGQLYLDLYSGQKNVTVNIKTGFILKQFYGTDKAIPGSVGDQTTVASTFDTKDLGWLNAFCHDDVVLVRFKQSNISSNKEYQSNLVQRIQTTCGKNSE